MGDRRVFRRHCYWGGVGVGPYRNAASEGMWGFLSQDGILPEDFRRCGREQLERYPTVSVWSGEVVRITPDKFSGEGGKTGQRTRFTVERKNGDTVRCRKVLLATGVVDEVPALAGIEPLYGKSVHHCPYCGGFEHRDAPLAVYGRGTKVMRLALEMTQWSRDLTVCTDGPAGLSESERQRLRRNQIALREEPIDCLEGSADGKLRRVVFVGGQSLFCTGLFFITGQHQRSNLAAELGCGFTPAGRVDTKAYEATQVAGVYVAGDASPKVQLAIIAAAEGTEAAFAINTALLKEDLR